MKIKKRKITKIEHYANCNYCNHEVKGNSDSQVVYNLNKHTKKCREKHVPIIILDIDDPKKLKKFKRAWKKSQKKK